MKKLKLIFLFIFLGSLLLLPLVSFAGEYTGYGKTIQYQGLVPCGKLQPGPGESAEVTLPCQFCHFFVMFDGIIDFIFFQLVPPIAVLMLAIGGAMFFFAAGDPGKVATGRSIMTSVIIGLVIIYGAWLILGLFFQVIGISPSGPAAIFLNWPNGFTIDCKISL